MFGKYGSANDNAAVGKVESFFAISSIAIYERRLYQRVVSSRLRNVAEHLNCRRRKLHASQKLCKLVHAGRFNQNVTLLQVRPESLVRFVLQSASEGRFAPHPDVTSWTETFCLSVAPGA